MIFSTYRLQVISGLLILLVAYVSCWGGLISATGENGLAVSLPGKPIKLKISLTPDIITSPPATINLRVIDHHQREQIVRDIIPGDKLTSEVVLEPLNLPRLGYFRVMAAFKDKAGRVITEDETAFAIIPDVELKKPQPESPFGIGAYYAVRFNAEELKIATQLQRLLGATWNREELLWDIGEPQPGHWEWERFDRTIDACRDNNILVLGLLDYWGKWALPLTEAGYTAFANYARTVAERYKPNGKFARAQNWNDNYGIAHWEVWNEPATFWSGTGEQFGILLGRSYQALKQVDPKAMVFFANWGESFDTKVITTAGKDSFDGIAPHYYCPPRSPEDAALDEAMQKTVEFFHRQGIYRPFWITEMGWEADNTLLRQRDQANFLVRSYVMALAAEMDKVFWYNFVNDGRDKHKLEFGLVNREDWTPKVGYAAYASMVKRLSGAKFYRTVEKGRPVRFYIFTRDGKTVAVLWSLKTEGRLNANLPLKSCRVYDIMGNELELKSVAVGNFELPLSPEPIYLDSELEAEKIEQILKESELQGIALMGIKVLPLSGALDRGTTVSVEIENYSSRGVSGTAFIKAPESWVAKKDLVQFSDIPPVGKRLVHFEFTQTPRNPDNLYLFKIKVTTTDNNQMEESTELAELVATYGTPVIDGNLAEWQNVRWIYLNKETQAVGLQPYADFNLSARIATQWNEAGFYFAGIVTDNAFHQPFNGDIVWQGDNFQLAFDTTLNRGAVPESPAEYLYGLSLTSTGPEVYRWRGGSQPPGIVSEAKLSVVKTPEGKIVYECFLPAVLLKPMKFEADSQFGFSFILNDNDGGGRRGWLEWTPGIGTGFNSLYFTIWTLTK